MTGHRWIQPVVAALLLAALVGCSTSEPPEQEQPGAVETPLPTDDPAPTAAPTSAPSRSPSPSPSPTPDSDLSEEAALAAARARRAERDDCEGGFADEAHQVVAEVEGRMLVHVVCFVGAYQPSGELRVWDGIDLEPIPVEQWQFGEVLESPEVVGFVEASPDGRVVTNDVKYRGLGDCGLHQRWDFDGSRLELVLARERECTDDGEFVPPDQWPVVHES